MKSSNRHEAGVGASQQQPDSRRGSSAVTPVQAPIDLGKKRKHSEFRSNLVEGFITDNDSRLKTRARKGNEGELNRKPNAEY